MRIKAVIWDIGGVIARTEDKGPRNQLAADLGVSRDRLNDLVFGGMKGTQAQLGEISVEDLWAYVHHELKLLPDEFTDIRDRFFGGDIIDYQIIDYIQEIKPKYKTAILSNAWNDLREVLTNQWKIADAFDSITISGEEGVKKPDPTIYKISLNKLSVAPAEAVFIDDFIENIQSAANLGIHTIHFTSPEKALTDLKNILAKECE